MSKNGYKSKISRMNYTYGSKNINNLKTDSARIRPQLNNLEDDLDFFSPISNQEQAGRIIHQSTEHSYDDMGNRVVTTKTVRELDNVENRNKNLNQSKKSYTSKTSEASKKDKKGGKYRRITKYTNAKNEFAKGVAKGNVSAMNNLGNVYMIEKNYSAAEKQYKQVLAIEPNNQTALSGLENVRSMLDE